MLPDIHRATQKFYIFLIVYLTGCTPEYSFYSLVSNTCSEVTNKDSFILRGLSLAIEANSEFVFEKSEEVFKRL